MHQHDLVNDDRLREVARILAAGILRLRARQAFSIEQVSDVKELPESGQDCLDVSAETRLSVHGG